MLANQMNADEIGRNHVVWKILSRRDGMFFVSFLKVGSFVLLIIRFGRSICCLLTCLVKLRLRLFSRVVRASPRAEVAGRGTWRCRIHETSRPCNLQPATCTSRHHDTVLLAQLVSALRTSTMGNCCGKPSDENFSGEGRTVASTPSAKNNKTTSKVPQGGRTLGSSSDGTSGSSPREAAAKAAEVRTHEFTTEPVKIKSWKPEPKRMVATAWI
jgi:hypothetical protein